MPYCLLLLLITSIYSINAGLKADLSETYRKFVNQKDMSEYCRRRVMPSVFLGRQIVDANSQMLHFSRLEVPYSCYINIRTDMGSNIIIVIQVFADVDLETMCGEGDNQLLIYELGETFGGYWGQMPDSVMKHGSRRQERQYTLTPTQTDPPTTSTTESSSNTATTKSTLKTNPRGKNKGSEEDEGDYLTLELPIVNVSAELIPGQLSPDFVFSTEDNFEFIYDVTPWPGQKYDTRILPLLEVAQDKGKGKLRDDSSSQGADIEPEFQVRFDDLFTPDSRLIIPQFDVRSSKGKTKFHPSVNKRINFKKNKQLFAAKEALLNRKHLFKLRPQSNKLYDYLQSTPLHEDKTDSKNKTWDVINDILKNLSNSKEVSTEPPHKELANILRGISMKDINKNVYLHHDLSDINSRMPGATTTPRTVLELNKLDTSPEQRRNSHLVTFDDTTRLKSVSQDPNKLSNRLNVLDINDSAINVGTSAILLPMALDVDSIILNGTNQNKAGVQIKPPESVLQAGTTISVKKLDPITVSLVNHESWDNVVQAAPIMAVKLNETSKISKQQGANVRKFRSRSSTFKNSRLKSYILLRRDETFVSRGRKRRYIQAIDIAMANPHRVQVMKHSTTTPPPEKFNMRDFQRLIELQDDEIHGRMSMRYVKHFVGLPLLKLCDFNETSSRHVYLFNSSRLVLALSNFTLSRMMIVMTPARTLLNTETRCAPAYLECQVSGARVCIDAHSACDGVPNCGSYNIYDEDRLSCGAAAGLRHNVCLAAVTFLAVLLTVLYTIHYWLKRCIPKVSDAFFIYTDAAENVLYLEPLMRSPHDYGSGKDYYRGGMQEYMAYEDIVPKNNPCKTFIRRCFASLRFRRKHSQNEIVEAELDNLYPQRLSTLGDIELNKLPSGILFGHTVDVAVQTTSSLEIGVLNLISSHNNDEDFEQNKLTESMEHLALLEADLDSNQPLDELNILQFFRREKSKSISSLRNHIVDAFTDIPDILETSNDEKEIQSHEYSPAHYNIDEGITLEPHNTLDGDKVLAKESEVVTKHLRFHDEAVIIPFNDDLDDENGDDAANNVRRSVFLGAGKVFRIQDTNDEPAEVEESITTGREFKSYFNWGKEKKKKKSSKKLKLGQ